MKDTLLNIIKDWVSVNKKLFWKYEVSSFYASYNISIFNMPIPSIDDIKIRPGNQNFTSQKKNQLCSLIKKCSDKLQSKSNSSINIQIDFIKGSVKASIK